jgi:hypothetical protein
MEAGPVGTGRSVAELEWICRSAIQATFASFKDVPIQAGFYPYVGLTHTIRRKGDGWVLRVSDHCRHAPRIVIEAIALILAAKVLRRKPPPRMLEAYSQFRKAQETEDSVNRRRLQRGRKMIDCGAGKHHSLSAIYEELNDRYFGRRVDIRVLGWGRRKSWGRLGHYDPVHHTITISPVLDSPRVPRAVVAFIVYHEMLHSLFGCEEASGGRNRHHPSGFRKEERAYPDYEAAKKFLSKFCRTRGK